jgi:tripartite ATP-independent transporter DctP family solute receptor
MKKMISYLLVGIMIHFVACSPALASSVTYPRMTIAVGYSAASTHPNHIAFEHMKRGIEAASGGNITMELLGNNVLGSEESMFASVIEGSLEACLMGGLSQFASFDPRAGVEELAFLFSTLDEAHAALDGEYGEIIKREFADPIGVVVLNYWTNGFRHFTNNIRPIYEPEDMRGIKFRSALSAVRVEMFETLGAAVISLPFSELFTALQLGTVDGQENPLALIESNKLYEVQRYLSLSGHIFNSHPLVFGKVTWDRYPQEVRDLIQKYADEAQVIQRQLIAEGHYNLLQILKDAGVQINEVNKQSFIDAVQPVWRNYIATHGDELIRAALLVRE